MRSTLVIMLKEPRPGRVKTRLGQGIGMVPAAWWFRHQAARLLREVGSPRWQVVLALTPDREGMQSRLWPAHLPRIAQGVRWSGADTLADSMARLPGARIALIDTLRDVDTAEDLPHVL